MLKIAIIYEDNKVYVQFSPEKFRKLFKKYFKSSESIDETFNQIIKDLKKATLNK